MFFPLAQLAVSLAIPCAFAGSAALGCWLSTFLTLGIVHKVFKNIGAVQLYHAIHVLLSLFSVWTKEVLNLVFCNFIPVAAIDNFGSQFRQNFNDE